MLEWNAPNKSFDRSETSLAFIENLVAICRFFPPGQFQLSTASLMPYHVLFDKQKRQINGIIDFGCAGLGDPAIGIGVIINQYGESFLERFYEIYPEVKGYLKRAQFYAGEIEMRWILTGMESGDMSWFAVHVDNAKDMKHGS